MRYVFMILIFLIAGFSHAIDIVSVSGPDRAESYSPVFINIELPYLPIDVTDPDKIEVNLLLTSPGGISENIPAFSLRNKRPGPSLWEARFTPTEEGKYSYRVSVKTDDMSVSGREYFVEVGQGNGKGFLRVCGINNNYLRFDSGEPFFGIGHNLAWVHNSSPEVFDRYFRLLQGAGGNLTRIWICDWSFPIECNALGRYDMDSSAKLDEVVRMASERGIYIILCLDTYGSLMEEYGMWGEGRWAQNPYNAANGGPCENPSDFFTDPEAIRLYRNRLRYIVSRWGYSPNILAFELWNEYNSPPDWTSHMASHIKGTGHTGHLVTTSLGYPDSESFDDSLIWEIPDIDIITFHIYGRGIQEDIVSPILRESRSAAVRYSKPIIVSEFGIDSGKDDKSYDPDGRGTALHNSIWASTVSGNFGSAMNWWPDTYVRPLDLYAHYSALSKFVAGLNWGAERVEYTETSLVRLNKEQGKEVSYRDISIVPEDKWGIIDDAEVAILNNGDVGGSGESVKYLHGYEKKDMKIDHVYKVNYPQEGKFMIRVGTVSQGGHLKVYLDGEKAFEREFPAGPGEGPWRRSHYLRKYEVYQCVYNEDIVIDVPQGVSEIQLSNSGKDWIGIEKITLVDYADSTIANARCAALTIGDDTIVWIHNRESNWKTTYKKIEPGYINEAYFEIFGLDDGFYEVEWWDTHTGEVVGTVIFESIKHVMAIDIPRFKRDIACKIRKAIPGRNTAD